MFINTKIHTKATSTRIRVCFEKGDFFLRYKWSPKTYIFKHSLQSEDFWNADFSFVCVWMKSKAFKYDDVLHHILQA